MSAKLIVNGSSSSGNNYLLQCGDDILILEAGVEVKKVLKSLNYDIEKVGGICVTHR